MKIGIAACVVACVAFLSSGCGTMPVKVGAAYMVAPGQPVGLSANPSIPAFVAEVEVDLSQIDIPLSAKAEAEAKGIPLQGKGWLVFGAEKTPVQ